MENVLMTCEVVSYELMGKGVSDVWRRELWIDEKRALTMWVGEKKAFMCDVIKCELMGKGCDVVTY
jgi:hypothetical protein